jgi:hypothetical protein
MLKNDYVQFYATRQRQEHQEAGAHKVGWSSRYDGGNWWERRGFLGTQYHPVPPVENVTTHPGKYYTIT